VGERAARAPDEDSATMAREVHDMCARIIALLMDTGSRAVPASAESGAQAEKVKSKGKDKDKAHDGSAGPERRTPAS